jgi:bifunctional UDP-N-acetylglucosamine pyrophosphorylase/glucosamine-1-phosphate N-acetyltransferase
LGTSKSHSHPDVAAVILAAGRGTRMKSARPKVLFELCGKSMLQHAVDAVRAINPAGIVVVVGHGRDEVKAAVTNGNHGAPGIDFVTQNPPRGTGDAARVAMRAVPEAADVVLVTYGDMPCLTASTLRRLIDARPPGGVALLTVFREEAFGFGRILRDPDGGFVGIREEKDCSPEERAVREVNVGVYAFDRAALARALPRIKPNNAQREYYLTDAVLEIASHAGLVRLVELDDESEAMGVNSLSELAIARNVWQERILDEHLANGVVVVDPASTTIDHDVKIGAGTVIHPFVVLRSGVRVGEGCEVGPFAHLRAGAVLEDGARVGNFVEVKKSRLGKGVKVMHLSYVGDATVGPRANIGAGTITANYDGKDKFETHIGEGAFIGSGTVLVAPSTVGKGAVTGAGAIVTRKTIPAQSVWVGVPARPHRPDCHHPGSQDQNHGCPPADGPEGRSVKSKPERPATARGVKSAAARKSRVRR